MDFVLHSDQKNIFEVKNVVFKNILHKITFSIEAKKLTCILGESGSGKTTTLKLLNKMINPDSGEVYFKGKNIFTLDAVKLRRKVTMIGQTAVVFSGNLKENLLIALKFAEKSVDTVDDKKLKEILKFVKLNKELDEACDTLSGGEKQRLALARVLLLNPEVFLLDEATSNLDEETAELLVEKMSSESKKIGKTLVMVSHSKKIAENYADRIIEIDAGRIKDENTH